MANFIAHLGNIEGEYDDYFIRIYDFLVADSRCFPNSASACLFCRMDTWQIICKDLQRQI